MKILRTSADLPNLCTLHLAGFFSLHYRALFKIWRQTEKVRKRGKERETERDRKREPISESIKRLFLLNFRTCLQRCKILIWVHQDLTKTHQNGTGIKWSNLGGR